jgi:hypothetical protein
LYLGKV